MRRGRVHQALKLLMGEGVLIMAAIARKWRIRLAPGHSVEMEPLVTLRPKHGMRMTIHHRV